MKMLKKKITPFCLFILIHSISALATEKLERKIFLHGIVKPKKMSTIVAIGQGLVNQIFNQVGDSVAKGVNIIQIFERDTIRNYNGTIDGKVAKMHVTNGAAISPGMPLVTVVDDREVYLEFGLSPAQAQILKVGAQLISVEKNRGKNQQGQKLGLLEKISPIVDPESGSVMAMSSTLPVHHFLIGQVISVEVGLGEEDCDLVASLQDANKYTSTHRVNFVSDQLICLEKNK